jgi:hypothetical protein
MGGINVESGSLTKSEGENMREERGETWMEENESMRISRVLICRVQLLVTRMLLKGLTTKDRTSY